MPLPIHLSLLPLVGGKRRGPHGIQYTDRELAVAKYIARVLFTAANFSISEPVSEKEQEGDKQIIYEIIEQMSPEEIPNITTGMYRAYRLFEDIMLSNDDTYLDFPMMEASGRRTNRNRSSLTVMFRKAIKGLVSQETIETMFKLYQGKVKS
jgi:hypothetical protein